MADSTWIRKRVAEEVLATDKERCSTEKCTARATLVEIQRDMSALANEAARFAAACASVNACLQTTESLDVKTVWRTYGALFTISDHEKTLSAGADTVVQKGQRLVRNSKCLVEAQEQLQRSQSTYDNIYNELKYEDELKKKEREKKKEKEKEKHVQKKKGSVVVPIRGGDLIEDTTGTPTLVRASGAKGAAGPPPSPVRK